MLTVFFTSGELIRGFWILLTGWLGILIMQFAWFANPLMLLALLHMERSPLKALLLGLLALVLASQLFLFDQIPTLRGTGSLFIRELGLGGYCWYGAMWFFCVAVTLNVVAKWRN